MSPALLGRYRLDEQVGQGGMAVVWRGFDTQLKRAVAVKILHPHLHSRAEIRRRFDREAQAVARLHHPHIIDVYDASEPEFEPSFLVTEFIPGRSLRAFGEAHAFDPPELAACCAIPLCEALEHAHAAGVVHRDVKPENVMVRQDGQIKLTDFGIAALLDPDEKFTVTGSILGSPSHLAPETIEGKTADPRTDLFSLGTVLYWLAAGRLPFHAATPAALLRQILDCQPQDPRMVRPAVSDGLAQLILKLLARDPAQRFQSAALVRKALEAVLLEAGIETPRAELTTFLTAPDPKARAAELRERLVARQLQRAEEARRGKRTTLALAAYGRVLALQPGHELAREQLESIRRQSRRSRLLRRTAVGAAAALTALTSLLFLRPPTIQAVPPVAPAPRVAAAPSSVPPAVVTQPPVTLAQAGGPRSDGAAPQPGTAGKPSLISRIKERLRPHALARPKGASERPPEPAAAERRMASAAGPAPLPKGPALGVSETPAPPSLEARPSLLPPPTDPDLTRATASAPAVVHATLNVHWIWASVLLDGEQLGENRTFERDLTVGKHRAVVMHDCCAPQSQTIDVTPDQTRYKLEPGTPKPARLAITGAPSEAQVEIDGAPMGPVAALGQRDLSTNSRPFTDVVVTVGDRSGKVTLQAGKTVSYDYLRLGQAAP